MEIIKAENLSFAYPNKAKKSISDISFSVNSGDFITICGKSGCGKSTLLRQLKPIISPYGKKSGNLLFYGKNIDNFSQREQSEKIGFILQNPESQIVTDKVWHELAFGLESLGIARDEIRSRVAETASFFGIQNWFHQSTSELSGGQKQLLNLASVTVMQPSVLILDEPTSQLDPISASNFFDMLKKINNELGTTVILSEHRLEDAFAISNRAFLMENGKLICDGSPADVGKFAFSAENPMFSAMPTPIKVYFSTDNGSECPITVGAGKVWLEKKSEENRINKFTPPPDVKTESNIALDLSEVWFRYEKNSSDILKGLSIKVKKGEFYSIVGGNGTGKTTSLSVISSIFKPYRGKIVKNGKCALLPQDPKILFTEKNVEKELESVIEKNEKSRINDVLKLCELEELIHMHPYDLSGGEQQKLALAKLLLTTPDILLMDEPTKGLDACFKQKLASIIKELNEKGVTVVIVSHDIEFCAEYADRCGMFFDGRIVSEGTPRRFFGGNSFYTTSAKRMAKTAIPNAILAGDIISALNGSLPNYKTEVPQQITQPPVAEMNIDNKRTSPQFHIILALFSVLIAVPFTIFLGTAMFDGRKYYLISCMIIAETLIPFLALFEHRRPKARELVVISVMCALGIAGRTFFYAFPHFKPVMAIVIISGIALGSESGFLIGAITAFVSNFFFGQGPWTAWQMFAFGIIGFIAGGLSNFRIFKSNKFVISIFGFFSAIIYGLIMNPAAAVMGTEKMTAELIFSFLLTGLPLDLVHGVSTFIFLWLASMPMLEKLERIKIKYGLMK